MTPAESELQLTSRGITGVPPEALSTVRTNAAADATPAGPQRSLPFVLGELTGARPAWPGAGLIDPFRIGMARSTPPSPTSRC
jgi:hypothetical protein